MILVHNYSLAIVFFVLTMICWGSWANTQKIAAKNWRFELFYWDLTLGLILTAFLWAVTLGSLGSEGRTFFEDIAIADSKSILMALAGGAVWNAGNLLLVAAIAVAGLAVAFPIGGGLAWVLGIGFNYIIETSKGASGESNPITLAIGVAVIIAAIVLSGISYNKLTQNKEKTSLKGILLSVLAGVFIAFFYGLVVKSLDGAYVGGGSGSLTPYTGVFFFAVGVVISTLIFNPIAMHYPVEGNRVRMKEYFSGNLSSHSSGILGGFIWMTGMVLSFMAVGAAGPAISYALSNAAPVVAVLWGVFIWKEFKDAPKNTNSYLVMMFIFYLIGLALITYSKIN